MLPMQRRSSGVFWSYNDSAQVFFHQIDEDFHLRGEPYIFMMTSVDPVCRNERLSFLILEIFISK